jgi:eukaryotic-like serine/threonine-protein kinase
VVVDLSKTDPQPDPLIGRKLDGRYDVVARLGEGGMGVVYRGRQAQLGRFVAIKVLHQDTAAIGEWRRRFEREAQALSALAHPNVVPVTDSGIDDGVPFLVMELLQGKTLADLLKEGPLPLWRALDIARQTLRGLGFAHGKGIVHRDLKPANVFLQALPDQTDHVRLLDFGMVKFIEKKAGSKATADTLTRAGAVFGTPAYMSPEQAKGNPADARTDVYAAGAVLFEVLSGRRPFVENTPEAVVMAHLTSPIPSLAKVRPGLGAAAPLLQPVVEKAMAKKPGSRFKDANAMLAALEAVIDKLPAEGAGGGRSETRRKTTGRARVAPTAGSRFLRWVLALVVLSAGIAAGGTYLRSYLRREQAMTEERATPPPKPTHKRAPPPETPVKPPPKLEPPAPAPAKTQATEQARPEEKESLPQPQSDRPARSHARNPWRAPVPRELRSIRNQIDRGAHPSQKSLSPLYEYAKANPDDPRPWLLLGHAYAELDWFSDAVDRYVRADHADSTGRGDPQMLADLLKAAAHPAASRAAARAIRDIYGAEALPAVDKAIKASAGDRQITARLTHLRESLPR